MSLPRKPRALHHITIVVAAWAWLPEEMRHGQDA